MAKNFIVKLTSKPKNPIVIEGFPGFGLVGTIVTEFLLDHLKCEQIGMHYFPRLPATVAIHEGKMVPPLSVHYNKKYNLVIVHSIAGTQLIEWDAADLVLDICEQLNAKPLISIEGVGAANPEDERVFYHTNEAELAKKYERIGVESLGEGIIVGVTGGLLIKADRPMNCLFAETHSKLPDARAAAKVIGVLDKIFGFEIDPKPLLKQAQQFEEKLKNIIAKAEEAQEEKEKKMMGEKPRYLG